METVKAEESRKKYQEKKETVIGLLDKAIDFYGEQEREKEAKAFQTLKEDLENGEFSIVIVGEFSAGKSTLLNALMRKRILPSYTGETTATVNFLRHIDKAPDGVQGMVYYYDGKKESVADVSLDTISEFVSTKGKDVVKTIDHLDLYLDSEFLKDGVTLVDSPGLNGVLDGHRQVTEAQILKSHASIFLFNSDHPGSKTDFEFLHDLQKKVKTIIFVLNKIDGIKADEGETVETVIDSLKKNYKKQFPDETEVPEIWPVSAYQALVARSDMPMQYHENIVESEDERKRLEKASRLESFEDRLMKFLTCGEKAHQQLLAPVDRIISIAVESKKEYEEEEKILNSKVDGTELEAEIEQLQNAKSELENQVKKSRNDIDTKLNNEIKDIKEEYKAALERLREKSLKNFEYYDDVESLQEFLETFDLRLKKEVERINLEEQEHLWDKILVLIHTQCTENANKIENEINARDFSVELELKSNMEKTDISSIKMGLDEMDSKIKEKKQKLETLKKEKMKLENDDIKVRKKEREYRKKEQEIGDLQAKVDLIELQQLPEIIIYDKKVTKKEPRGGIFGTVLDVFIGEKKVLTYEKRTDSSARDEQKKENAEKEEKLNKRINEIKTCMPDYIEIETDVERLENALSRANLDIQNMQKEIDEQRQKNIEEINRKYDRMIRKMKRQAGNFCDDIIDAVNKQVGNILNHMKESYKELIINTVEIEQKKMIEQKINRIEQLKKQIESSESEKAEKLLELKKKKDRITDLLTDAADIQTELECMEIDEIQKENL